MVELFTSFFIEASELFDVSIPGLNISFYKFFIGYLIVRAAIAAYGKILGNDSSEEKG